MEDNAQAHRTFGNIKAIGGTSGHSFLSRRYRDSVDAGAVTTNDDRFFVPLELWLLWFQN
jgi:hypothetical protein